MAKEKDKKKIDKSRRETLDLKEFLLLTGTDQNAKIEGILRYMYDDQVEIEKKYIEKVLNIAFDVTDNEMYLPYSLKVEKVGSKLNFYFKEKKVLWLFILFFLGFLFIGGAATYSGIYYVIQQNLNIDINNDGVADINIDITGNNECDINCNLNGDHVTPERNIDYRGNRKPTFNIQLEDGTIKNPVNQDLNNDGKCDINCDTNNDGWPDINLDLDGDGKADINIDSDDDGIADLNIDLSGDGVCDLNCDDDGDGVCDTNCAIIATNDGRGERIEYNPDNHGGQGIETASLLVVFENKNEVVAKEIYPDDQNDETVNTKIPDIKFRIENNTSKSFYYDLKWLIEENTFETDNFWFRVIGTNGGFNKPWGTAPKIDDIFGTKILIPARTTQEYTVSMTLHGIGEEQNIDQGKNFVGKIQVLFDESQTR